VNFNIKLEKCSEIFSGSLRSMALGGGDCYWLLAFKKNYIAAVFIAVLYCFVIVYIVFTV
jgi:hypothetical protein